MSKYLVQYSHDRIRWYDYGSDVRKRGIVYDTLGQAEQALDTLRSAYMKYLRVWNVTENSFPIETVADAFLPQ